MKVTLIVIAILLLTACSSASSGQQTANQSSTSKAAQGAKTGDARYEVKVMRNGAGLASYSQTGSRPTTLYDGRSMIMFLNSPDDKHILTVSLQAARAGAYPLATEGGAPKQDEARLEFMSENAPVVLIAEKGELKIEEFDEKTCSGTFAGTGTDIKGVKFAIEGSFSNMGVKNVAGK